MEDVERIAEFQQQGFCCSQILILVGLEYLGKDNADLVRAAHGLCHGLGSGELCGTLTAAACVLGLYTGRGGLEELGDTRRVLMLQELVDWFRDEYGQRYGGIGCDQILAGSPDSQQLRCPGIIVETWEKAKELLIANGYDLAG